MAQTITGTLTGSTDESQEFPACKRFTIYLGTSGNTGFGGGTVSFLGKADANSGFTVDDTSYTSSAIIVSKEYTGGIVSKLSLTGGTAASIPFTFVYE